MSCVNATYQRSASRAVRRRVSVLSRAVLMEKCAIFIVPSAGVKLLTLLIASFGARKV